MTKLRPIIACGFALLVLPATLRAQASPATIPVGLDSLNEERLLGELANRGLESLLERAFVVDRVPRDKQDGIRTLLALRQLATPGAKGTPQSRQELIASIVRGVEQA